MKRFYPFLASLFLILSCANATQETEETTSNKILFVVSNQDTYGNTNINAANHFGEIVFAYHVFIQNNFQVDFVSPKGGSNPNWLFKYFR